MLNFYQEVLMDHYRNPRNCGVLQESTFCSAQRNSSCGDEVILRASIADNKVVQIMFEGKGCVVSQATASMLCEHVVNKSLNEILVLDKDDLIAMIGMSLGPVRLLCSLLSLTALQNGVRGYQQLQ
jgi:nitrogen fixation NifU-like protein